MLAAGLGNDGDAAVSTDARATGAGAEAGALDSDEEEKEAVPETCVEVLLEMVNKHSKRLAKKEKERQKLLKQQALTGGGGGAPAAARNNSKNITGELNANAGIADDLRCIRALGVARPRRVLCGHGVS